MSITQQTYLTFILGLEEFGLDVNHVTEVLEQASITPVPRTPKHIRGVINFRGEILPVVDIRILFNMNASDISQEFAIVVVALKISDKQLVFGIIADSVNDVVETNIMNIKAAPEIGLNYTSNYILGMLKSKDTFIMLIEPIQTFRNLLFINNRNDIES